MKESLFPPPPPPHTHTFILLLLSHSDHLLEATIAADFFWALPDILVKSQQILPSCPSKRSCVTSLRNGQTPVSTLGERNPICPPSSPLPFPSSNSGHLSFHMISVFFVLFLTFTLLWNHNEIYFFLKAYWKSNKNIYSTVII